MKKAQGEARGSGGQKTVGWGASFARAPFALRRRRPARVGGTVLGDREVAKRHLERDGEGSDFSRREFL